MEAKRFTLHDFFRDFYTPTQCLEYLRKIRWPDGIFCKKCQKITKHHLHPEQKAYSCQYCGTLVTPTKGTIFFGSKVVLPNWFWVIFQFAKTRTGITSKQIERELGVSYKTALRMCNAVRSCLEEDHDLSGQVELDETYMGNSRRYFGGKIEVCKSVYSTFRTSQPHYAEASWRGFPTYCDSTASASRFDGN